MKPFNVPSSLDALHGPTGGTLHLPLGIYWGPNPVVDLDTDAGLSKAYQSIIAEGRAIDQETLMNAERLRYVWSRLQLPVHAQALWESAFPELGFT